MNKQLLKKVVAGLIMALTLSFGIGMISTPTAEAQSRDRRWDRDRDGRREYYRNRSWDRRREQYRNRSGYWYGTPRNYPYYGNSGRYDSYGRYNQAELERGYRNGLKEGRDDAEDRDSFNPSRHSSFRNGNPSYREGFARGYEQGYRQYAYSRRW